MCAAVPAWQKNSKMNCAALYIYSQREMQGSVCVSVLLCAVWGECACAGACGALRGQGRGTGTVLKHHRDNP